MSKKYVAVLSLAFGMAVSGCTTIEQKESAVKQKIALAAIAATPLASPEHLLNASSQLLAWVRAEKTGGGIYYMPNLGERTVKIVVVEDSEGYEKRRTLFMEKPFSWFPASTQKHFEEACVKAGKDAPALRARKLEITDNLKTDQGYVISDPVTGYVFLISSQYKSEKTSFLSGKVYRPESCSPAVQEIHRQEMSRFAQSAAPVPTPAPDLK